MLLRTTLSALCLFACWFLAVGQVNAQEATTTRPTKPPLVHLGQTHLAVLVESAEEPTVELTGHRLTAEQIERTLPVTRMVQEERIRVVTKDGQEVEQKYTVQVPVRVSITERVSVAVPGAEKVTRIPAKLLQAWDLDGEQVDTPALLKRLASPQHVIVITEPVREKQVPIDPFYRSVLKKDLLFVYAPKVTIRPKARP